MPARYMMEMFCSARNWRISGRSAITTRLRWLARLRILRSASSPVRRCVLAGNSERCYAASRRIAVRTSDALLILRLEYCSYYR